LLKLSIIREEIIEKGKRKFPVYKANINSETYRKYKKIFNLIAIHESGLIEFLSDSLSPRSITLFGSYQRGEDTEDSDIDIFVECNKEAIKLDKFEDVLSRKIELHFKTDFQRYPDELKNNIINGIVLKGFLVGYK
jgi:predicted nucleotidyltransferase